MNVIRTLLIIYSTNNSSSVEDKIGKIIGFLDKDEDHFIASLAKKISSSTYQTAAQAIVSDNYY